MVDVKQEIAHKVVQERQTQEQLEAELRGMLLEVKRKLKGESKNELLRIIGALLLDNYALKLHLEAAMQQNKEEKNESETPS